MKDAPILFAKFMIDYRKHYATIAETMQRYENFKISLADVIERNNKSILSAFDIEEFSDMSEQEFEHTHGGLGHIRTF